MAKVEIPAELKLERETCSRCGGSGQYSYCQRYGSTCFRCGGKGQTYTKRGTAALVYLKNLRSKPYGEVALGDKIRVEFYSPDGSSAVAFRTVKEIKHYDNSRSSCTIGGVLQVNRNDLLTVVVDGLEMSGLAPESRVELLHSSEQGLEFLRQAKAYEATLTLQGTPRKRQTKKTLNDLARQAEADQRDADMYAEADARE